MGLGTEERGVIDFLTGGGATGARMRAFDWSIAQRISGAFAEGVSRDEAMRFGWYQELGDTRPSSITMKS